MVITKEQQEHGSITKSQYEDWAEGVVFNNKLLFHDYTKIDFKFDDPRINERLNKSK